MAHNISGEPPDRAVNAARGRSAAVSATQQLADAGVRIWLDDTGVLHCVWPSHQEITAELARLAVAKASDLAGDRRLPLLVSLADIHRIGRGTYAEWAAQTAANKIALLGHTPVDRVIANFAIGLTDLPLPTRYFDDETAALRWLRDPDEL